MAIDNPTPDSIEERAQPGDVLGIEEEGETTHLGDTAEDEDDRLSEAEEDAAEELSARSRHERRRATPSSRRPADPSTSPVM